MLVTDLVSPFARHWLRRTQPQQDLVPRPLDTDRQFAPGPDPDRVLVLGSGPAVGFGVLSQELALPGQLARRLAAATGRGAAVDVAAQRGLTVANAATVLDDVRLNRYDLVLITLGTPDAFGLLPVEQWRDRLFAFLGLLRELAAPSTELVLLAISPLHRTPISEGAFGRTVARHAERLDASSAAVCERLPSTTFVPAPAEVIPIVARGADAYAALAERIVPILADRLDRLADDPEPNSTRALRRGPDPEILRQAALERSRLTEMQTDERLDRLVRSARDLFGTQGAAITLIDGDRQLHASSIGLDDDVIPRDESICTRTIRGDRALVIEDTATDPASAAVRMQTNGRPVRFYAGYPLESPDGFRIGALCVFDPDPREPGSVDETALAEIAALVQNDLWAKSARLRAS